MSPQSVWEWLGVVGIAGRERLRVANAGAGGRAVLARGVGLMTGDDAVEGIVDESRWVRKYAVVDAGGAFEVEE